MEKDAAMLFAEQLQALAPDQACSPQWTRQQEVIQGLLSLAQTRSRADPMDNSISWAIIKADKASILVQQILAHEIWLEKVLPHLKPLLASNSNPVQSYLLIYQGSLLGHTLEAVLQEEAACQTLDDENVLELIDWSYRRIAFLVQLPKHQKSPAPQQANGPDCIEEFEGKCLEIDISVGMSAISILRNLAEHVQNLALAARVCSTHDFLTALIQLINRKPWRRSNSGRSELYVQGMWRACKEANCGDLCPTEAQVWLLLNRMLLDPDWRSKCLAEESLISKAVALRGQISEHRSNQLPFLKGLVFLLEQLKLGCSEVKTQSTSSRIPTIEQVVTIRRKMLMVDSWEAVAECQKSLLSSTRLDTGRLEGLVEIFENLAGRESAITGDVKPGRDSNQIRINLWKEHAPGVFEPSAELCVELDASIPPESIELKQSKGEPKNALRYRLKAMNSPLFPTRGKCSVSYRHRAAQALVQLPAAPVEKALSALAPVVWVNVGQLRAHGIALQMKLKKCPEAAVRDKDAGTWSCYKPVGGAITMLLDE